MTARKTTESVLQDAIIEVRNACVSDLLVTINICCTDSDSDAHPAVVGILITLPNALGKELDALLVETVGKFLEANHILYD